ncbi:hypothetical protein GTP46_04590 [Duganella sp. FT135W]|uniref:Uncharacterized protein n=1 Tax=Duganella flavida TaxID=2692175 RepID=A0A6L8K331_9BURK|nr:hypothetical protein [Duganella flavida]MYM21929.1 hypothetical protein [Duganella flavida]
MSMQLSFDFDAPNQAAPARRRAQPRAAKIDLAEAERKRLTEYWSARNAAEDAEARGYWMVGMVTCLPLWSEVQDSDQT